MKITKPKPRVFAGFIVIQALIMIILVFVVTPLNAIIIRLAGLFNGDLSSICFSKWKNLRDIHVIKHG